MKIATWNVNSVKARKERLLAWIAQHNPDVLCLQELKTESTGFPADELRAAGYEVVLHGQKTYNGVAIVSRVPAADVRVGLDDGIEDPQARLIAASFGELRVLCAYVPNGGEVGSPKWQYKLAWLDRLAAYLARHHTPEAQLLLCGDINVAPDDRDVARPEEWKDTVLCAPPARAAFQKLTDWGLVDVLRQAHPEGGIYSWWDYRMLGFPKNNGLRIDHILATPPLAKRLRSAEVDREQRKGQSPSDHAPVIADFEL